MKLVKMVGINVRILLSLILGSMMLFGFVNASNPSPTAGGAPLTGASGNVVSALCGIVNTISTVIAIFSLVMFILGGTLYALAHFLPAAGNFRSGLQGWGMGMIIGGIVALILFIAAPYIVTTVAQIGGQSSFGTSGIQTINCNS